ncbi:hypothetical protein COPRO5265_0679 [Coprothermobacter proteolyticus DSM 5265]|uniref:Division initiation protein n=1 Tax=Coprothermobacter proteolyticus (strain ATCC 35245 / DSM 5265 / OCM 4 / BT) TaxID=309798 RepID=B5Y8D0_COPPD|nr:DUF881 domain-containing protein [Coprothermobacter proteolyticus]ACI17707.1 hypothetical protein COPRO5265_0679 [Coprothermobacter proteolyticus DSM 5265]
MKRASYWIILLLTLFICFILGYQRSVVARSSYVLTSRKGQLIAQIEQKENDLNRLKEEVQSLTEEVASFPQVTPSTELEVKLAEQEEKLGFSELKGPGIIITLADSKQKPKPDDDPNYYIVHDWQIRNLVRFLLGVGADGVAVNDQRIVFNSEIVCAGPIIIVNGQRLSPPYRIFVVGDPKLLQEKLESFPDLELLKALRDTYGLVFQLETSPSVSLPGRPVEVLMSAK